MRAQSKKFLYFKIAVYSIGLILFLSALFFGNLDKRYIPEFAVFFLLLFIGDVLPIRTPGTSNEHYMTLPAVISFLIAHGPVAVMVISPLSILAGGIVSHWRHNPRWVLSMSTFNTALNLIVNSLACGVYYLAGGVSLSANPSLPINTLFVPLFISVIVATTFNLVTFSISLSLYNNEPLRLVFAQNLNWMLPNYFVTAPSAILFAYLYQQFGVYGIMLIIIPFIVGRQALNVYSEQVEAYRETITTLGAYMQRYHPYTRGHLERVANMSNRIARHMGLPTRSLMLIKDAGLLHDIGKVGVNEEILDNTNKLSDEEWAVIKQHPATGSEILTQMKHLEHIVPWVRGHHERPDGRGYPDGLKSSQIPIEAAVISVADAFDAMTDGPDGKDGRVYRKPLTLDEAMNQVRFGAGTQFNPLVVKAFLQIMAEEDARNAK